MSLHGQYCQAKLGCSSCYGLIGTGITPIVYGHGRWWHWCRIMATLAQAVEVYIIIASGLTISIYVAYGEVGFS